MKTIKELFDLLHNKGEGVYGKVHIIELDTYYDYEEQEFYHHVYRVYHSDGYCFEVSRLKEDNPDEFTIEGYYYTFNSDMFEGFKSIKDSEHAICLIKNHL
jgi:hypothetical protein